LPISESWLGPGSRTTVGLIGDGKSDEGRYRSLHFSLLAILFDRVCSAPGRPLSSLAGEDGLVLPPSF
jgi:hypothetical protein